MPLKNMLIGALILGLFAVTGTALVALTQKGTAERIAENERQALLDNLHQVVPPALHDNDLYADTIKVRDPLLGTDKPVTVYRARQSGQPVAAVIASIAPDGYGGGIKLLVGIRYDGTLSGVRVIGHKETPGLGDAIEAERSDWILGFSGRSLVDPAEPQWKVKKDGGVFDQFTGATITPRAVVQAVYNTLRYYQNHREELYASGTASAEEEK
ncbi:MAG: electron transport complex subunit RsxG [Gammaproteobacteria bacterium]|nr:electron transport complex subunit RsxG [Gammaproteobacteria bacterium]MCW8839347.1 electron transport complex subunit RsxG [Gammaproteobacteria bacterium]MCW8958047.1 electron transport complex subunit RsxG [Gammaproteobacteria bacterium]MCW8973459.1 electron transport complex subunit RsxG [Gammaproteobacteria bacterium]MCW8991622.1 electron transport complex subunit RsxG [Gammaproteobacteria bacterium]